MRKAVLLCVLAATAATALAVAPSQAGSAAPDDGCLVVQSGRGIVQLSAKGFVFGRFDEGQVEITDPVADDGAVKVFGYEKKRAISETKSLYIGFQVRFRASGAFRIRVEANSGIEVSAAAKGTASLSSDDFFDAGQYSVDAASFCEARFQAMPDVPTKLTIAAATSR